MALQEAFDSADIDKGGSLELDEFEQAFGEAFSKELGSEGKMSKK